MKALKFGDRVINHDASDDNPRKIGIFVRRGHSRARVNRGAWIELTDGEGNFWKLPSGKNCNWEKLDVSD